MIVGELIVGELIDTVSVGRRCLKKAASLYLIHYASEGFYAVSLRSVNDGKNYNVLTTESRDDAVKAFQSAAGILFDHGKDYLLEKLKSTEGLCIGES